MAADAPTDYEGDVRLQKASAELIEEFDRRLILLLRKPDSTGRMVVRTQVASRDTYYLTMQVSEGATRTCMR